MAGNILTPEEIFGDANQSFIPKTDLISESRVGETIISRVYLHGRELPDAQVKIYSVIAHGMQLAMMPAIIVFSDLEKGIDEDFIVELANKGYYVFAIDLAGIREEGYYTIYPESISYANYFNSKNNLFDVKTDIKHTCHYEWGVAGKYALSFVTGQPFITRTGAIGIESGATALWHVAATSKNLAAAVFIKNAGWKTYKGRRKFGNSTDPQLSDSMLKYVAGVEPQSYAMHVKCPTLIVSATNDKENDFDRAYDTASRIGERVYKAVSASVERSENISEKEYEGILCFLNGCLFGAENANKLFPKEPELKCGEDGEKIFAEVSFSASDLNNLSLFVGNGVSDPALRVYKKITEYKTEKVGKATFSFVPEKGYEKVYIFACAEYKNGFSLITPIICKPIPFKPEKRASEKILFSGIKEDTFENFVGLEKDCITPIDFNGEEEAKLVSGPMDIKGITSTRGIKTYKINSEKDKPMDDASLMFDCSMEQGGEITVEFLTGEESSEIYSASISVAGGAVWHNVIIEINKLKTDQGKILKSYSKVSEVRILGTGKFIINNILWV